LYADPPWPEDKSFLPNTHGGPKAYANTQYRLLSLRELSAFALPPIQEHCFLFLWTPFRKLEDAVKLCNDWGFTYARNGIVWVKTDLDVTKPVRGLGHRFLTCHELCLLGVRGRPVQKVKNQKSVLMAPRTRHSQKPEVMYEVIERYADGPYVELFARRRRQGWHCYGDSPGFNSGG
jgi:N6-adenosine-specific RNA methylase IME4